MWTKDQEGKDNKIKSWSNQVDYDDFEKKERYTCNYKSNQRNLTKNTIR